MSTSKYAYTLYHRIYTEIRSYLYTTFTHLNCFRHSNVWYSDPHYVLITACCDTGSSGSRPAKKVKTNNIYCDVCDLECTSDFVYDQHIKGSKHAKRLKNLEVMKLTGVQAESSGANMRSKSKNFSLRDAIKECKDSIIGC